MSDGLAAAVARVVDELPAEQVRVLANRLRPCAPLDKAATASTPTWSWDHWCAAARYRRGLVAHMSELMVSGTLVRID